MNQHEDDMNQYENDMNMECGHEGGNVEMSTNAPINLNETAINRILYSVTPRTSTLTDNCKEYRCEGRSTLDGLIGLARLAW